MGVVEEAWAGQERWSKLADRLQLSLRRFRWLNLALLVLGAVAGALAAQSSWMPRPAQGTSAGLSAVSLALAAWVQQRYLGGDQAQRWPQARSASEAMKAGAYRCLARVSPDGEAQLRAVLDDLETEMADLALEAETVPGAGGSLPDIGGIEDYLRVRAVDQEEWHRDKVGAHLSKAKLLHRLELTATLVATLLAAVAGVFDLPGLSAWVAAATTVAAALAAHVAATQHRRIAATYLTTANRLRRLIAEARAGSRSDESLVDEVEAVLAQQNANWTGIVGRH